MNTKDKPTKPELTKPITVRKLLALADDYAYQARQDFNNETSEKMARKELAEAIKLFEKQMKV